MDSLEVFPAYRVDSLLAEMRRIFEYDDTPITQEMIDRHFRKLETKSWEQLDFNSQELILAILTFYDNSLHIIEFYFYDHSGPRVYFENNVLKFPKIIARLNYG